MAKTKFTIVDKKKLMHEIEKRGLTLTGVSEGCGYSKCYLYERFKIAKGQDKVGISVAMTMLLFEKYNIRTESIIYEEPKVTEPKVTMKNEEPRSRNRWRSPQICFTTSFTRLSVMR